HRLRNGAAEQNGGADLEAIVIDNSSESSPSPHEYFTPASANYSYPEDEGELAQQNDGGDLGVNTGKDFVDDSGTTSGGTAPFPNKDFKSRFGETIEDEDTGNLFRSVEETDIERLQQELERMHD